MGGVALVPTSGGEERFDLPPGRTSVRLVVPGPPSTSLEPPSKLFEEVHEVDVHAGEEIVLNARY